MSLNWDPGALAVKELPPLADIHVLLGGKVEPDSNCGPQGDPPDWSLCLKFNYCSFILFHNHLLFAFYMPTTLLGILGFKNEQDTDPTVLRLQVFKIFFFFLKLVALKL